MGFKLTAFGGTFLTTLLIFTIMINSYNFELSYGTEVSNGEREQCMLCKKTC